MDKLLLTINIRDFFILNNYQQVDDKDEAEIASQNKVLLCKKLQEKLQNLKKIGTYYYIIER